MQKAFLNPLLISIASFVLLLAITPAPVSAQILPTHQWTKEIKPTETGPEGTFYGAGASRVTSDSQNNLYLVGDFVGNVDFDPGLSTTKGHASLSVLFNAPFQRFF